MNSAYYKECLLALVAFLGGAALCSIYPLYFLFPGLTEITLFGFPGHYFLTLFFGWIVLMPLYAIYMVLSEKIDREIENSVPAVAPVAEERKVAQGGAR